MMNDRCHAATENPREARPGPSPGPVVPQMSDRSVEFDAGPGKNKVSFWLQPRVPSVESCPVLAGDKQKVGSGFLCLAESPGMASIPPVW